jgi:hypothetical protein
MSPRAASRLESIGFKQVYDYTAGKAEWEASTSVSTAAQTAEHASPSTTGPVRDMALHDCRDMNLMLDVIEQITSDPWKLSLRNAT